jgi:hypothetical protein
MAEAARRLPSGTLPRIRQPEGGSYYSWPRPADWEVTTDRPARWAFNFLRGVAEWGTVTIRTGARRFRARQALGYAESGALEADCVEGGGRWRIQFTPGILDVVVDAI